MLLPLSRTDSGMSHGARRRRSNSTRKAEQSGSAGYFFYMVSKCFQVWGIVVGVELLTHLSVVVFSFLVLLSSSLVVTVLQKPWAVARKLTHQQWLRIGINGVMFGIVWVLWAKGLQECGALRTIILEHSHVCIAGLVALVMNPSANLKRKQTRGEMLFLLSFLLLLYHSSTLTNEDTVVIADGEDGQGDEKNKSSSVLEELGLMWGLVLLVVASLLGAVRQKFASKVSRDIGGPKRLHSLSLMSASLILFPLVLFDLLGEAVVGADYDYSVLSIHTVGKSLVVGLLVVVLPFYTNSMSPHQVRENYGNVAALIVSFLMAMLILYLSPVVDDSGVDTSPMDHEKHYLPLMLAWLLAVIGLSDLARVNQNASREGGGGLHHPSMITTRPYGFVYDNYGTMFGMIWGKFSGMILADEDIGHSLPPMPPLYEHSVIQNMSWNGFSNGARRMYRHVMSSSDSRKIAIFLAINLLFMFVEVIVGMWTNSLGLISDAGHMFFDCMALFIGLFASFVSKWKADRYYTYGYGRYEIICGFVNGVFLVFIAVFIMTESLERLSEPPVLKTSGLLTTSIAGFLVNLVGLVFFHDHSHLGSGDGHGHSHDHHGHSHGNENMHGVFLHILADALGSLGVIISSLLIEYKGWYIADPLCSLMISILIILSVIPLLESTAKSLLLITPKSVTDSFKVALGKIIRLDKVVGIREPHVWQQNAGVVVVSMHVIVNDQTIEQHVLRQVKEILGSEIPAIRNMTVQAYRESVYHALLQSKRQQNLPLFWDPNHETLVPSTNGILSSEQKRSLQQQTQHSCHGHSHDASHGHSHANSHGHSHRNEHGHSHENAHGHSHGNSHDHGHSHESYGHSNEHGHHHHHHHQSHSHDHGHAHKHSHEQEPLL